ncbi:MAG: cyclic nucleotide-binding domain-containing protein [Methylobacter sp.]|nr:cyclic nucleotide-binding domain-containing protein [Methylobacter sp.]
MSNLNELINTIIADPLFPEGVAWKLRLFQANEVILQEGDVGKSLYIVQEGKLRVSVSVALEERRKVRPGICDLAVGDIFGEVSLYEAGIRNASVTAVTDGSILEIDGVHLSGYLDTHSSVGYLFYKGLFEILIKRLTFENHRVESLLAWGLKAHDIERHLSAS